ncbi:hypothetical protein ABZ922_34485 [Streptomyces shenzhenensis]|uniref:hypothetical protein n=1 Tax=Streptomyces shenzhenensis TaxID=943815 RepID=UPI0033C462E9
MPRRHQRNALLAALLAEADWGAADLLRAVHRIGRVKGLDIHYDRTAVAHWVAGSRPKAPVPDLVAEALTCRIGRLVRAADTGLLPGADPQEGDVLTTAVPVRENAAHRLVALGRIDADPARRARLLSLAYRQFLVDTGHDAASPTSPAGPRAEAATSVPRQGPRTATADVELLRAMVSAFASYSAQFGGGHARAAPAAYVADDVGRMLTSAASSGPRTEMMTVLAQLTHVLGDMTVDAGHHGLAQRYYLLALEIATEAGDRRGRAIALRAMSVQAVQLGAPRYAANLAEASVDAAGPSCDGDLRAFLFAQRAHTRALTDDSRGALKDLAAAERNLERTSGNSGPFSSYPKAGFAYQRGQTLYMLGDTTAALSALSYAAQRRAPHERRVRALTHARYAEILLELGRVEEACTHAAAFAEDYPLLRSHWAVVALKKLCAHLAAFPRVRRAVALLQRLRELEAGTPPVRP